jgi:hypothetical protein
MIFIKKTMVIFPIEKDVQIVSWPKELLSMKKDSLSDKKQRVELVKEK